MQIPCDINASLRIEEYHLFVLIILYHKEKKMEHADKLIIVADMGELKSYKVSHIAATGRYHVEPISDIDYIEGRKKSGDFLSDDRGNFGHASGKNPNAETGENLHAEHEKEHRVVQLIADDISAMLASSPSGSCYLAFPTRHHGELMAALSEPAKKAVAKSIASDLVKCPADELLKHFS
jgi:protein required for attachment to host cells